MTQRSCFGCCREDGEDEGEFRQWLEFAGSGKVDLLPNIEYSGFSALKLVRRRGVRWVNRRTATSGIYWAVQVAVRHKPLRHLLAMS